MKQPIKKQTKVVNQRMQKAKDEAVKAMYLQAFDKPLVQAYRKFISSSKPEILKQTVETNSSHIDSFINRFYGVLM